MSQRILHYYGRVHPERVGARFQPPPIKLVGKIEGDAFVTVFWSQVTATIAIAKTDLKDDEIRFYVEDFLGGIVNMLGFSLGFAYDFELVGQIGKSGNSHEVFGVDYPESVRDLGRDNMVQLLLQAVSKPKSFFLFRSLKDIKEAGRTFHDAAFHCYRAIESMMQFFRYPPDGDALSEKDAWELMRTSLDCTREEIDKVKCKADPARHGKPVEISVEERNIILCTSVALLDKFVKHLATHA